MNNENENGYPFYKFYKNPEYFFDYGLQCFTHTEYDILQYIIRNTIGWNKLECELSIKNMALMRKHNEKNIIKSINNLIEKTNVFSKIVYREKGSCIKKTKYIITENSVKILNDYVKNNLPPDFEEKKNKIKNRSVEAENRLAECKEALLKKQELLLVSANDKNENTDVVASNNENDNEKKMYLLEAYREIINGYYSDNCNVGYLTDKELDMGNFTEYKEYVYKCVLGYIPNEKYADKIDIRISGLLPFTENDTVINTFNNIIEYKNMTPKQKVIFENALRMEFEITNTKNFDRINVIYE